MTMQRRTAESVGGVSAAVLATAVFVVWRDGSTRWASAWPGHLLGVLGFLLMLWAGFAYSRRKRHPGIGVGAMRDAMHAHIVAGLVGPYLVILHSGLAFHGVAGVLTLLTVLMVASGIVGRAVVSAVPTRIEMVDPVRAAMLDAELARVETELAVLGRSGHSDQSALEAQREALRVRSASVRHEQELLHAQWRQETSGQRWRSVLSVWWYLHIPVSAALWVLAVAHIVGSLYYATFSR
jgi:hypothetical protein